jgi:hypothetical protein
MKEYSNTRFKVLISWRNIKNTLNRFLNSILMEKNSYINHYIVELIKNFRHIHVLLHKLLFYETPPYLRLASRQTFG